MGKQQYGRKSGFKRGKSHMNNAPSRAAAKKQRTKDEIYSKPAQDTSDEEEVSEELSTLVSEEEVEGVEDTVYKEPSEYDNLLRKLGSGNESVANAYRRRLREEEGRSDTDDGSDSGSEEPDDDGDDDDEDDDDEGTNTDSHKSLGKRSNAQGSSSGGAPNKNADTEIDDDEASETDEDGDVTVNGQLTPGPEESTSSFSRHLDYKLSKAEIDSLEQRKWKYKWEAPANGMTHCKWMGTGECFMKGAQPNFSHDIKSSLYNHWLGIYKASGGNDFESSKQKHFLSLCNSYRDILHHNKKPFYLKGLEEDSSVMDAYLMHSLNHIFRTRDLVTKNEAKLANNQNTAAEVVNGDVFLDHGFTRPKVLVILPLASIALRVVKRLIQLTPSKNKVNVEHLDRFCDEFGTGVADTGDDEGDDLINMKLQKPSKPSDFESLFGGNNLDHFMVGIKFTRRSIRLYGDFYSSDMIVASPLAIVTKIGEAEADKEKDLDYLSSIEVLVIDHADVISMQNWSHVSTMVEQMNKIPSKQHGTDIMRIRPWYFEGQAQFYRQTIILGNYLNPDISALFNRHCVNYEGKVKLACDHKGVLSKVVLPVRQIYDRFDTQSIVDVDDARLEHFVKKVFPKIKDSVQGGVMIFVSSYFEFVRVRNFLKSQEASFCSLGEYTKQSDISRARLWFFQGKRKIMLYTERAHFYHRYKIRGIQNLIIYSLPERKEFYPEIVNMLEGAHNMTCTTMFCRFDQLRLERIVGTGAAKRMGASDKNIFVFC